MVIYIPQDADTEGMTRAEVAELEVTDAEAENLYDEYLDEIYPACEIAGIDCGSTARILKEVSPVDWRCGFADWTSEYLQEVDLDDFPA